MTNQDDYKYFSLIEFLYKNKHYMVFSGPRNKIGDGNNTRYRFIMLSTTNELLDTKLLDYVLARAYIIKKKSGGIQEFLDMEDDTADVFVLKPLRKLSYNGGKVPIGVLYLKKNEDGILQYENNIVLQKSISPILNEYWTTIEQRLKVKQDK